ncbi:MAG TPA: hypothetical protein VM941_09770 [Pyrinomonadaceae bacterium]|nr:hypothetical protein [Pyrinomonadaceae bacterium]
MDTIKKRQEEATSKDTLSDLEEETSLDTDDTDDTDDSDGPSPDGAFDDEDELKDADPI